MLGDLSVVTVGKGKDIIEAEIVAKLMTRYQGLVEKQ